MTNNNYLSISEFARITCITRVNLIFYDKINLLNPEHRGKNGYRYYTRNQLPTAFLIASLREIGISISEIKTYAIQRTPEKMLTLFETQEAQIQKEIYKLNRIREMMKLYSDMAIDAIHTNIEEVQIVERNAEPIFLGPCINDKISIDDASVEFYEYASEHEMELSFPFGGMILKENLLNGSIENVQHFYFKSLSPSTSVKPSGNYVVGFMRGEYGNPDDLYVRLLRFIKDNNLTICGNAYEEYPLGEISTLNQDEYLLKLEIMVDLGESTPDTNTIALV